MANMKGLVSLAILALVLVAVFQIVPMVGDKIDSATGDLAVDSQWNSSVNTDLQTGSALWTDVGSMIGLGAIVLIIAGAVIGPLMGIGKRE